MVNFEVRNLQFVVTLPLVRYEIPLLSKICLKTLFGYVSTIQFSVLLLKLKPILTEMAYLPGTVQHSGEILAQISEAVLSSVPPTSAASSPEDSSLNSNSGICALCYLCTFAMACTCDLAFCKNTSCFQIITG